MLTATIENASTLEGFYEQIRGQQEDPKNHGPHYCSHHDLIKEFAPGCTSYKELGTHQGASAAAALLAGFKEVHFIDHTLEKYNWQKHLFEKYCEENPKCFIASAVAAVKNFKIFNKGVKEGIPLVGYELGPNQMWVPKGSEKDKKLSQISKAKKL